MPHNHPKHDLYAWIYLAANFQGWGWSGSSFLKHFSFSEGGPTPLSWLIFLWNLLFLASLGLGTIKFGITMQKSLSLIMFQSFWVKIWSANCCWSGVQGEAVTPLKTGFLCGVPLPSHNRECSQKGGGYPTPLSVGQRRGDYVSR